MNILSLITTILNLLVIYKVRHLELNGLKDFEFEFKKYFFNGCLFSANQNFKLQKMGRPLKLEKRW